MLIKDFKDLPAYMQNDEVRKYYDYLQSRRIQLILKRLFDITAAIILCILLSPVFLCVPGMARIQLEIDQPQVVTAKCSEPQVVDSDVRDGGSGVAILSSVRTETGYKAKWWIRLHNKPKSKR